MSRGEWHLVEPQPCLMIGCQGRGIVASAQHWAGLEVPARFSPAVLRAGSLALTRTLKVEGVDRTEGAQVDLIDHIARFIPRQGRFHVRPRSTTS